MGTTQTRIVVTGLFFLFIFLSGLWLSHSGRPFNTILLTIHKLIGLGALVFLVITMHQVNQQAGLNPTEWLVGISTVLLFVVTIILGGLLSLENPMPPFVLLLHQIAPFLVMLATAASLYLLLSRGSAA